MEFVEHDGADAVERGVVEELAGEDPFGHHAKARYRVSSCDRSARGRPTSRPSCQLFSSAMRAAKARSGDAPRLEHHDEIRMIGVEQFDRKIAGGTRVVLPGAQARRRARAIAIALIASMILGIELSIGSEPRSRL
jgi:hypothetical protein